MDTAVTPDPAAGTEVQPQPVVEQPKRREAVMAPSGDARRDWLMGKEKQPPKAAEPATAEPSESGSAPDSERKAEETKPDHRRKPDAEERIRQLIEENKQLKAERDAKPKPEPTKAEPSPARAEAKPKEAPKKPKMEDFKTFEEYDDAKDKYYEDLADFKAEAKVKEAEDRRAQQEQQREWNKRIDDAKGRYKDFDDIAKPFMQKLADVPPIVQAAIGGSDVWTDLIYVLGSDSTKVEELMTKAARDPLAAIREIVLTEQLVREELKKGGKESKEASKEAPERDEKGKFVSQNNGKPAPPPPLEVGGRGAAPADEVETAVSSSDFASFKSAANRRDLEKRGRR